MNKRIANRRKELKLCIDIDPPMILLAMKVQKEEEVKFQHPAPHRSRQLRVAPCRRAPLATQYKAPQT